MNTEKVQSHGSAPLIVKSRLTKGAKASEISLEIGEKVKYKLRNGKIIDAIIKSGRMRHPECRGSFGYEALTLDDNTMNFIDVERIVSWEGKDGWTE
jgi:hypothetical protein